MEEIKFKMPGFFEPGYEIINLRRSENRKHAHHLIVIEFLKGMVGINPTRDQLQKLVRIRRRRFIQVLKYLINCGEVIKVGTGLKGDPFRYRLGEKYQR